MDFRVQDNNAFLSIDHSSAILTKVEPSRETLLGASLNSEYGASLRSSTSSLDENFGANVPNSAEKRLPDLGSDWQKDVDRIGYVGCIMECR